MTIEDVLCIIEVKLSKDQKDDIKKLATTAIQQIIKQNYHDITIVKDHHNQGKQVVYVAAIGLYHVSPAPVKIGWSLLRYQDPNTNFFVDFDPFKPNENSNWVSLACRSTNAQR